MPSSWIRPLLPPLDMDIQWGTKGVQCLQEWQRYSNNMGTTECVITWLVLFDSPASADSHSINIIT
jgi:hypothetical protein